MSNPETVLPLPSEGPGSLGEWQSRISQAKEQIAWHRDKFHWTTNVDRYVGKGGPGGLEQDTVLLPKDYAYTEQKKPLLFYQLPDVVLTPARPDVPAATAQLFQSVLNEMVGADQLNALPVINEVLTDVLVPAGIGILKLGYETFVDPQQPTVEVEVGQQPAIDPLTGQPQVDPFTGQPVTVPIMETVPNILREKYFLSRISPVDFLCDTGFRGSDWTKCPWMGWRFRIPVHQAVREYGLMPERLRASTVAGETPDATQSLAPDRGVQHFGGVEGVEIYYRGIDFDPTVGDPDLIRCMVFVEGIDQPVKHENSRVQQIEGNRVVGGLRRAPLFPLTLRYVSDMPLPPSDCAMSRVIVDELSKGRTQMLRQRDRNISMRGVDISKVTPDSRDKVLSGEWQEMIPFEGLDGSTQPPIFGLQQSAFPQENFNFNNIGERDLQECWALSGHNLGTQETSGRTATELSLRQQGTETRMAAEQTRVELWWVSIVQGLASYVQQFADLEQYTRITGPQGAQQLVAWTKQDIAGEFAFSIRPDSAKRVDQAAERKFRLDALNLMINIPGINQPELIKWAAPSLGLNPESILLPPQPQPPQPPQVSMTISGEDLNPMNAQFPNVVAVLQTRGITIQTAAPSAPGQPGANGQPVTGAPRVPPVNQHQAALTGQLPGGGSATTRPS